MVTQLVKMVFLATFFPMSDDEDDVYLDKEIPFDALTVRYSKFISNLHILKIVTSESDLSLYLIVI